MSDDPLMDQAEAEASTDDIKTLLASNRTAIEELKSLVAEHIPEGGTDGVYCAYDEIFFLRYILSFSTAAAAEQAVIDTIQFRARPESQTLFQQIHTDPTSIRQNPLFQKIRKYQCGVMLDVKAQQSEGPTVMVRGCFSNPDGLFANMTHEEQLQCNMIYRELAFRMCDTATRARGKLAKQVLLFDMTDVKFGDMMDRRQSDIYAKVTALSARYYPQLLAKLCMVNAPSWMSWVLSFFKTILPRRNTDKIDMFTTAEQLWTSEWAQRTLNRSHIPVFVGGELSEEDMDQDLTGKWFVEDEEDHWHSLTVAARSSATHSLDIPFAGMSVDYAVTVAAYGINMSARLTTADQKTTQVVLAESKVKADGGLSAGVITLPEVGTLVVEFDNTYSYLRSKTVKFKLVIDESSAVAVSALKEKEKS